MPSPPVAGRTAGLYLWYWAPSVVSPSIWFYSPEPESLESASRSAMENGDGDAGAAPPQRTLVVYSGPTSLDRNEGKNGMYMDNMDYFLEHGVSCVDDVPDHAPPVLVDYVFVLTPEVANHYTAPGGPVGRKAEECNRVGGPRVEVLTREDRCYDMESLRMVVENVDVAARYDDLMFVNCGLVGPKFGPGSPTSLPAARTDGLDANRTAVPFSHWSQLYTSMLSESVKLVGHSINTHFRAFSPHVQSFLFATRTSTLPLLTSSGAIYDCGLSQEELGGDEAKRMELIARYEVGMSTQLLARDYRIAAPFVNRFAFGIPLAYGKNTTLGMDIDAAASDLWYEDGIRSLTANRAIPLWEHFVFFKASRFVPADIQREMRYDERELAQTGIPIIENAPRTWIGERWCTLGHLHSLWKVAFLVFVALLLKRKQHHFKKF